ncbi:MAG: hypothetical protein KF780_06215 [Sphingomonas sp.]|nr:hypothetical protein [Sphingomonas sp.]
MTFKIKMLAAAAMLSAPGLVSAQSLDATGQGQVQTPPVPPVDHPLTSPVTDPVQDVQDTVRDTMPPVPETPQPQIPDTQTEVQTDVQADASAEPGTVTAATAADVQAGAAVRDQTGAPVGTIESVEGQAAVLNTGTVRAEIPISSFGKDSQGLVLAMTRAQLEAAAGVRTPS